MRLATFAFAVPLSGAASGASAPPDALVVEAMRRWEVPGLAYAVFEDGAIGRRAVFGLRDVQAGRPVTPRTVFALGSISKSFTVALLWRLAEEGRLDWDAAPARYIAGFRFSSGPPGRPISVRDLVSHRSGLSRHDALWYFDTHTGETLLSRIRHLRRFAAPGNAFAYSNLLPALAGRVAYAITGMIWSRSVRRFLTRPLAIKRVRIGYRAFLAAGAERALGYFPGEDGRIAVAVRNTDSIAPAAAIYADIDAAARWLAMLVGRGRIGDLRVLSAASVEAMWTPASVALGPVSTPELAPVRYGMGFYLTRYRGRKLAYHPGVIDGYAALIAILPQSGFGIVVLTNRSGANPVPSILAYAAFDRHLGVQPISWIARYPSAAERREARARRRVDRDLETGRRRRALAGRSFRSAAAFAGTYRHPAYGAIVLSALGADTLAGRMHGRTFTLERWGALRWRLTETRWPLREGLVFDFTPGDGWKMRSLAAAIADGPTYRHNPGPLLFERSR